MNILFKQSRGAIRAMREIARYATYDIDMESEFYLNNAASGGTGTTEDFLPAVVVALSLVSLLLTPLQVSTVSARALQVAASLPRHLSPV